MNSVELIGRLATDPQTRGETVSFILAVDRPTKAGEEKSADFPRLKAFKKTGETIAKYLSKGRLIGVKGHINTDSYLKGGVTVYTTDVIVDNFEFLDHGEKHSYPAAANKIEEPADFEQINEDVPF
jgi:single-strand DNA-binding protein